MAFCRECGTQIPEDSKFCLKCGVALVADKPKVRGGDFPSVLWLLPLIFAFPGGVVAAFISALAYKASWWELFIGGLVVSGIWVLVVLWAVYGIISL